MNEPLIKYPAPLLEGIFVRRYKRFSVEAQINGEIVWVHTNNTGSMRGLLEQGRRILVSKASNSARKMAYTLEYIESGRGWCGVNTSVPNRLLKAAFEAGKLDFAKDYIKIKMEQALPSDFSFSGERARFDAVLTGPGQPLFWVECKNVTLVEDGVALFPDAATVRGQKHLRCLMRLKSLGMRAACVFWIQRNDADSFAPAVNIDPEYARLFKQAKDSGVEMYIFSVKLCEAGLCLTSAALQPISMQT